MIDDEGHGMDDNYLIYIYFATKNKNNKLNGW
jgi:hypothetical protein